MDEVTPILQTKAIMRKRKVYIFNDSTQWAMLPELTNEVDVLGTNQASYKTLYIYQY